MWHHLVDEYHTVPFFAIISAFAVNIAKIKLLISKYLAEKCDGLNNHLSLSSFCGYFPCVSIKLGTF